MPEEGEKRFVFSYPLSSIVSLPTTREIPADDSDYIRLEAYCVFKERKKERKTDRKKERKADKTKVSTP